MSNLSKPIKIGNKTAPNRLVINAMECCDADEQGNPSKKTYRRYKRLFEGGAGVVILEAITVQDEYKSRKNQLTILPGNKEALKEFVGEMKEINPDSVFLFQLTHSGEISNPNFSKRCSPKHLPGYEDAEILSEDDVKEIIQQFARGAKIAYEAGVDGVDLKLCHGYLGSQMLRPYNDRDWAYGGSWENRSKFAYELIEAVKETVNDPDFIIGSKVSACEFFPGGQGTAGPDTGVMDLTETLDLIKGLEERGADFILQSAGSPSHTLAKSQPDKRIPDDVYLHHTFQQRMNEALKSETVLMGSAYSVLRDGKNELQAVKEEEASLEYWGNKNIEDGVVDMVAIGRQSLADPYLPSRLIEGNNEDINWCTACDNCIEFLIRQQPTGCATYEKEYTEALQEIRRKEGTLGAKRTE